MADEPQTPNALARKGSSEWVYPVSEECLEYFGSHSAVNVEKLLGEELEQDLESSADCLPVSEEAAATIRCGDYTVKDFEAVDGLVKSVLRQGRKQARKFCKVNPPGLCG